MPLPEIESGIEKVRGLLRSTLAQTFAPELAGLSDTDLSEVLDELEVLADPLSWRLRRLLQDHSSQTAAMHAARSVTKIMEAIA